MSDDIKRRGLPRRAILSAGLASVALGALAYSYWPEQDSASVQLSAEAALEQAASGEIILIDIRRPDEWRRTGVPQGAIPIDMRRADFAQAVKEAAGDTPVALICARGVRSRHMALQLTAAGIGQIIDVPEGMLGSSAGPGWLKKGLPTVTWEA